MERTRGGEGPVLMWVLLWLAIPVVAVIGMHLRLRALEKDTRRVVPHAVETDSPSPSTSLGAVGASASRQ